MGVFGVVTGAAGSWDAGTLAGTVTLLVTTLCGTLVLVARTARQVEDIVTRKAGE